MNYEKLIADLQEQIDMLKSESGDLVNQLQAKIKSMTAEHETTKTNMEQDHENQRSDMNRLFDN